MATVSDDPLFAGSLAELLEQLGGVPLSRIRRHPPPGTATEEDVLRSVDVEKRFCELVDGVLVEKPMGAEESVLGGVLLRLIGNYAEEHDLGLLLGEGGTLRLLPGVVRIPDVSFVSWDRLPEGRLPRGVGIPDLAPDLAVEVLSPSNTKAEMKRKLREYFLAGVRVAWLIDPPTESAEVYTAPGKKRRIPKTGVLDGGTLLPGFRLPLADLFARTQRRRTGGLIGHVDVLAPDTAAARRRSG